MIQSDQTPYYAVIFTSLKKSDSQEYNKMAERMESLSRDQEGFLGIQSVRGKDGLGITVSYWISLEAITKWKSNSEHQEAQINGKTHWYTGYEVRVCRVEREYKFGSLSESE